MSLIRKFIQQIAGSDVSDSNPLPSKLPPIDGFPQGVKVVDNNGGAFCFDAFSRAEVAQPYTLGDYTFNYDSDPLNWDAITTGGSAAVNYNSVTGENELVSGSGSGDQAIFSTRRYFRYQAGKAGRIVMSANPSAKQTGVVKRWGLFDDNDGFFFELTETDFKVIIRSSRSGSVVDTAVAQGSFNGDNVDGLGPSGFLLDFSKANIFQIDYQWLGVGTVTFRVTDHRGIVIELHKFQNANMNDGVYCRSGSLPARFEVTNVAPTGGPLGAMNGICCSIVSNGGEDPPEIQFSAPMTAPVAPGASWTPLISIRLSLLFKTLTNRMLVVPRIVDYSANSGDVQVAGIVNGALTGASFSAADPESGVEFDIAATAISGGILAGLRNSLGAAGGPAQTAFSNTTVGFRRFGLSLNAAGTQSDILTLVARDIGGSTPSVLASLDWGEIR